MNREIKFRGKRLDNGKWVYGDLLRNVDGDFAVVPPFGIHLTNYCDPYEVNPDTIGQFTGLRDKNGKEIYEGDILTIKEYDNLGILAFSGDELKVFSLQDLMGNLRKEWKGDVEYGNASFYIGDMWLDGLFGDMRCSSPIYEYELIGNIYYNKDLLED